MELIEILLVGIYAIFLIAYIITIMCQARWFKRINVEHQNKMENITENINYVLNLDRIINNIKEDYLFERLFENPNIRQEFLNEVIGIPDCDELQTMEELLLNEFSYLTIAHKQYIVEVHKYYEELDESIKYYR